MSYLRPIVLVYQEYARMSTASQDAILTPCIIGPCFHIIDPVNDFPLPYIGEYTTEGIADAAFPFNKPGAKIEESSVTVHINNAKVKLNNTPVTQVTLNTTSIGFTESSAFPTSIAIGDTVAVVYTEAGSDGDIVTTREFTITNVSDEDLEITTNRTIPTPSIDESIALNFYRTLNSIILAHDSPYLAINVDSERVSVSGVKTIIGGTLRDVVQGSAVVGYKALRTDLVEMNTVRTQDEARGVLGKLIPENPLGYAVSLCLANTTVGTRVIGVSEDTVAGYGQAMDLISNTDDVYSIVPLTRDTGVLAAFKVHAQQMSTPNEGKWRIVLGNSPLPTQKVRETGTGILETTEVLTVATIYKPTGMFLSNGVKAGQDLYLTKTDNTKLHVKITNVVSEDRVVFTKPEGFTPGDFDLDETPFEIIHVFDKTAQAEEIKGISSAYNSARFVHVWPDIAIIDGTQQPGYYLCAILAGMIGGLPSHHGFTRLSVGGVSGVRNSSDYFNQQQLDTIASGGTFIFVQNNPSSPVYGRHQLTTDMSTIEFRELSFVKNFDYVSYMARRVLERFLGQYNITEDTLALLRTSMDSLFETLKLNSMPRIGSPVLGYSVTTVRQLEDTRDRVEIYVDVQFPYVLNVIGLHLVSQ